MPPCHSIIVVSLTIRLVVRGKIPKVEISWLFLTKKQIVAAPHYFCADPFFFFFTNTPILPDTSLARPQTGAII